MVMEIRRLLLYMLKFYVLFLYFREAVSREFAPASAISPKKLWGVSTSYCRCIQSPSVSTWLEKCVALAPKKDSAICQITQK